VLPGVWTTVGLVLRHPVVYIACIRALGPDTPQTSRQRLAYVPPVVARGW